MNIVTNHLVAQGDAAPLARFKAEVLGMPEVLTEFRRGASGQPERVTPRIVHASPHMLWLSWDTETCGSNTDLPYLSSEHAVRLQGWEEDTPDSAVPYPALWHAGHAYWEKVNLRIADEGVAL